MQATRQYILDYLRHNRGATVKELSRVLRLTPTGIRQHLAILDEEGYISSYEQRGSVGRPAQRFTLTEQGDAQYPKRYDMLANALLDEVRGAFGSDVLQQVITGVATRLATEHEPAVPHGASPETHVEAATRMLRSYGSIADWERSGGAFLIHQRTCPYPHVARHSSAACEMDVAQVREVTGMSTSLTSCLAQGDSWCTYRVEAEPPPDDAG